MYNALKELDTFKELERELARASAPLSVSGCMSSQKLQLVSGLNKSWMLYIAADEKQASDAAADLKCFNESVWIYPARDLLFDNSDIQGGFMRNQRMEALKHLVEQERGVIVTTIAALMEPIAPRQRLIGRKLKLYEGMVIQTTALSTVLTELGYRHVSQVEGTGEYAVRGGIFDIYPVSSEDAYRIEFFDDEIDTIRSFDIVSQRSSDRTTELEVYPADSSAGAENSSRTKADGLVLSPSGKANATGRAAAANTASAAAAGRLNSAQRTAHTDGALQPVGDSQAAAADTDMVSLYTYFDDDALIVLDDPVRLKSAAEATEEEYSLSIERRLEKGIAGDEEPSGIFAAAELIQELCRRRALLISGLDDSLAAFGAVKDYHFNAVTAGNYKDSFELLISDIKKYQDKGYRISVLTPSRTRCQRLAATLREYDIKAYCPDTDENDEALRLKQNRTLEELSRKLAGTNELKPGTTEVVCGNLRQGFIYPDIKYALMTETDMFGSGAVRKRKRKKHYEGDKLISLSELSYGDYVVHEDHGIGVYRGLEHIVRDGTGKDYIKLEYADGGKLYLPATKLDLIQKYADSTAKPPKLNKLNGTEWAKTRQRTVNAVKDIAKELIQLYAKRLNGKGFRYSRDTVWQREFEELFPYEETEDQLHAIEAVKADMESDRIMDRLICGDVGFGKTEIALRAAFKAVQDGKQVIFLVPTTILAQQHYNTFVARLSHYPVKIEMMSRFRTADQNRKIAAKLKTGAVDIVIGTHRLLSKDVEYKDPGLLIIDEEQRFGVTHKEKIKKLKDNLDVLSLTATPIPRTLHMSLSGIRDLSTLEEPPFDRVPIQTYVMEYNDEFVREAMDRELKRGGQVFYVYNHVQGIDEKTNILRALAPDARIEYAHGQMNERELEDIMNEFVRGEIDVLVSTTIVETGLDIPNANTLIVDGAERMGLSQLYQLRGRVGRSNRTSYAFLMYRKDKVLSEDAEKRLKAIREFTEFGAGIRIAMRDLEIRGAGNVLGAEQHGQMQAVGYDLYCKLLSQAVRLMQGQAAGTNSGEAAGGPGMNAEGFPDGNDINAAVRNTELEPLSAETSIDCDIDAFIPDEYISDEYHKLDIYKRIAEIETKEEYEDMQDELTDRFGDPPKSVQNLLDIVRIKSLARKAYITELDIRSGSISMHMHPKADIKVEAIPMLIERERGKLVFYRGTEPKLVYMDKHASYKGTEYMMNKAEELIGCLAREP